MITLGELIERFIEEHKQPGYKPLGDSHYYVLRRIQRAPIAKMDAAQLKVQDYVEHCRGRKAGGAAGATVNHDITFIRLTLRHAAIAWDMEDITLASMDKAILVLKRLNFIHKAGVRNRRPSQDELEKLMTFFREQDQRSVIPMAVLTEFALVTARRRSEICRIKWSDIDYERRTCWVRDLKSPRGKGQHAEFPLLGRAWDIVMAQPRVEGEDRIFPYNHKSVGARYTIAKHMLGIKDLRFHDNRREAISRLFEQGYNVPEVAQMSLHKAHSLLLRVYTALKPEDLHKGPAAKRTHESEGKYYEVIKPT